MEPTTTTPTSQKFSSRVYPFGLVLALSWIAYTMVTLFWALVRFVYFGLGYDYSLLETVPLSIIALLIVPVIQFFVGSFLFFGILRSYKNVPLVGSVWAGLVTLSVIFAFLQFTSASAFYGLYSWLTVVENIVSFILAILISWYLFKNRSIFSN